MGTSERQRARMVSNESPDVVGNCVHCQVLRHCYDGFLPTFGKYDGHAEDWFILSRRLSLHFHESTEKTSMPKKAYSMTIRGWRFCFA
eukprot:4320246-Amphidinium_carterae.1